MLARRGGGSATGAGRRPAPPQTHDDARLEVHLVGLGAAASGATVRTGIPVGTAATRARHDHPLDGERHGGADFGGDEEGDRLGDARRLPPLTVRMMSPTRTPASRTTSGRPPPPRGCAGAALRARRVAQRDAEALVGLGDVRSSLTRERSTVGQRGSRPRAGRPPRWSSPRCRSSCAARTRCSSTPP